MKRFIQVLSIVFLLAVANAASFPIYTSNFSVYTGISGEFGGPQLVVHIPTKLRSPPCGVQPNSEPYQAEYIVPGAAGSVSTTKARTSFTAAYPGSNVAFFDLLSAFIGCGAVQSYQFSEQHGPGNRNIAFLGYRSETSHAPVAKEVFLYRSKPQFTQDGIPYGAVQQVEFSSAFRGLRKVVVEAVLVPNEDDTRGPYLSAPSIYLDDVKYVLTNKTE